MNRSSSFLPLAVFFSVFAHQAVAQEPAWGLAPEITDLNAADLSFAAEAKLPDLESPFVDPEPAAQADGIAVGALGPDGGDREAVLAFAREIADGTHGEVDSLLIWQGGKLLFESYYRRGRANYPHYQMSITKSYTAMAIGRAIQLGHLSMTDLDKPVVSFLDQLDRTKWVAGAEAITLAEAMNMRSGVRVDPKAAQALRRKNPEALKGQGQVQAYLSMSRPIPEAPRSYKYQGADPSMAMQVLEASVPGGARAFIDRELLGRMGITNYAWQADVSGLPKSAAGSSMRSRDMVKWGQLVLRNGLWEGKPLLPAAFVQRATARLHTNPQGTSYGFFWWRHATVVDGEKVDCISGRGAGGQFIQMFPGRDLIVVVTAHNKGMGKMLSTVPKRILPGFADSRKAPWTFVSIPDFLNFDIEYPQKGWEDGLGFILQSMKAEDPAFAMVAGDLVMGHWGTEKKEIDEWAARYYPQWRKRFADHDLKVYAALGDHEIGDNPWRGARAAAVPHYKAAFRTHMAMPLNGPEHLLGTAFHWRHRNAHFIAVDVFETGKGKQGEIAGGVTGRQLAWFEQVLREVRPEVDHIIVMGHIPVLRPVRTFSSSGMLTEQGRSSAFWQTMAKFDVDLYLCGEVHAVTCTRRDGVQQIAHGGLIGRTERPNYLRVGVHADRLELELKEIPLVNGTGRLWQKNKSRGPWDTITISEVEKARGFRSIGRATIRSVEGERRVEAVSGFFDESDKP